MTSHGCTLDGAHSSFVHDMSTTARVFTGDNSSQRKYKAEMVALAQRDGARLIFKERQREVS